MKLRIVCIIAVLALCMCNCAQAQELDRVAFVGAGYFDGAQAKAVAGILKRIAPRTYSHSEVTFGMAPKGTGNFLIGGKDLQADFSTGILYSVYDYQGFTMFGIGDIGLQQTGPDSSAMFKAGGGIHKPLSKNIGIAIFGTWKYSEDPVSRTSGWKVNPAASFTVRF